jgi:histidinol-phosphate aminotransferase
MRCEIPTDPCEPRQQGRITLVDETLRHHGDAELAPGLVDLAVNVRSAPMPEWLAAALTQSLHDLARYPDAKPARTTVAARFGRPADEVLLTAGAAEAFVLLARALRPRRAVVVHPQFTEPEAALLAAGHEVERVMLTELDGFTLDATIIPTDADLVVVGNPTNPTSVAHPAGTVAALARPGRVLVVDEAFADTVHAADGSVEPNSLAHRRDLPGLVVVRSLTKTWGLAGLRVGYLLGDAPVLIRLSEAQPLWPVSTPALAAIVACTSGHARHEAARVAAALAADRDHLVTELRGLGIMVAGMPASSFVLVKVHNGLKIRGALRANGFAVRRGDTFPGLGPDWLRIAVRDVATTDAFVAALASVL